MARQAGSGISWTDETWNPIRGCSRVSEGCRHCYAERVAGRFSGPGQPYEGLVARGGQWNGQIRLVPEKLEEPLRWRKPRMVFVNSMSDLFHENVPEYFIDKVFAAMAAATQHKFQVLTKRPRRMWEYLTNPWIEARISDHIDAEWADNRRGEPIVSLPLPNVWLGVSVEDQPTADERIPPLLQTPAAVRWVSGEPLLSGMRLDRLREQDGGQHINALTGRTHGFLTDYQWPRLDWVVAGGESGPGARPAHPNWFRSLRDQCQAAGVAFHFKQWGGWCPAPGPIGAHKIIMSGGGHRRRNGAESLYDDDHIMARAGKKRAGRELDGRTWDEYPPLQ